MEVQRRSTKDKSKPKTSVPKVSLSFGQLVNKITEMTQSKILDLLQGVSMAKSPIKIKKVSFQKCVCELTGQNLEYVLHDTVKNGSLLDFQVKFKTEIECQW